MKNSDIEEGLRKIANNYNFHFLPWGIPAFNWIWYKVEDEKGFRVQVFTHDDDIENIQSDIVELFSNYNYSYLNSKILDTYGRNKDLYFMDTEQYQILQAKKENNFKKMQSQIYNIGTFNSEGSNITFGNVINSKQNIDNSICQIEESIKTNGGDDKEELYSILKDTKEIINTISNTKEIKHIEGFKEKLSNHLSKHSWFYSEIVSLIGNAVLLAVSA